MPNPHELKSIVSPDKIVVDAFDFFAKLPDVSPATEQVYKDYAENVSAIKGVRMFVGVLHDVHTPELETTIDGKLVQKEGVFPLGIGEFKEIKKTESGWLGSFDIPDFVDPVEIPLQHLRYSKIHIVEE